MAVSAVVAADEWMSEQVQRGGRGAMQVLVALAEAAPDGDDGATVEIGPVEDLIYARALSHVSPSEGSISLAAGAKLGDARTDPTQI